MKARDPSRACAVAARSLTILRVLAVPPFLWLFVAASRGAGGARVGLALLFAFAVLSDYLDGRIARAAGSATHLWGVIDVCADIAFNVAGLGVAAVLGRIGPFAAIGVATLGATYLVRVIPTLARVERASEPSYDRLGHVAGVSFYVLVGLVVGNVAVGIPGETSLRLCGDAVFAYTLFVLGVRAWPAGKRSA